MLPRNNKAVAENFEISFHSRSEIYNCAQISFRHGEDSLFNRSVKQTIALFKKNFEKTIVFSDQTAGWDK